MTETKPHETGTTGAHPADDVMREKRLQRNLKILVTGLGILILLGVGAVITKMVSLAMAPRAQVSAPAAAALAGKAKELRVELPNGAKVVSVSLSDNRLALHHEGPGGTGILVIDLTTGERIADVKPQEALPRN